MASSSNLTLDDLDSSVPPEDTSLDPHLSFPTLEDKEPSREITPPEHQPRQILNDRLYIGNLHPSVDEYTLLQIFSKFGKVTKLDFLFHKSGTLKGKPRGYAFIEYGNKDDALMALNMAHEKQLRGRKLVVTFAHQAPLDQHGGAGFSSSLKSRKAMNDAGRPTTLSMIKTGVGHRNEGKTQDKIAIMEAKLRQMESLNPQPKSSTDNINSSAKKTTPSSLHPSLPAKPPPQLPSHVIAQLPPRPVSHSTLKHKDTLPSLPLAPPFNNKKSIIVDSSNTIISKSTNPMTSSQTRSAKSKLVGVKIKKKEKDDTAQP